MKEARTRDIQSAVALSVRTKYLVGIPALLSTAVRFRANPSPLASFSAPNGREKVIPL